VKALTWNETTEWCATHGVAQSARLSPARPEKTEAFPIPQDAGARIALVAGHLLDFDDAREVLVWFTEWGVWPSSERPHIFERFLLSYGEPRPLSEVPAFLFGPNELEDALSFATLGVLFLWDIHILEPGGQRHVDYSHDEFGWASADAAEHRRGRV
jgi:hypothetical protein